MRRIRSRLLKGGKTTSFKTITPPASLVKVARLIPGRRRSRRTRILSYLRRRKNT